MSVQDKDERAAFEKWFLEQPKDEFYYPRIFTGWEFWQASRRAAFDRAIERLQEKYEELLQHRQSASVRGDHVSAAQFNYAGAVLSVEIERLTRERNGV